MAKIIYFGIKVYMIRGEHIAFRTKKEVKEVLQKMADEGYRTLSQQCEMIIVEWLKEKGHLKEPKK